MAARVALAARGRSSTSCADRCRLVQVDGAAIVLPEHRDQATCFAGDLVDDGAEIRLTDNDVVETHLPDCGGARIDERGRGGAQHFKQLQPAGVGTTSLPSAISRF